VRHAWGTLELLREIREIKIVSEDVFSELVESLGLEALFALERDDPDEEERTSATQVPKRSFIIGHRIRHKIFGKGRILEIRGTGRDETITIQFDAIEHGRKRIKPAYTSLAIVDESN